MSEELVKRLRNRSVPDQDCEDAADTIERLTRELAEARAGLLNAMRKGVELCKERDTARQALVAVLPDAEGWQPIETAPKDGTVVLVYAPEREGLRPIICTCNYHPEGGWCVDELRFVTHWQPLPAPPKEKADE